MIRTIDELLADARLSLHRVDPGEAAAAAENGALLVDIRPAEQRARDGTIPGALVIDRNVLEWRLDPASPDRIQSTISYDTPVIIVCNEGYASSLAAATLQQLGLRHATDLDGGFQGWRAAGLPIVPGAGE
jgi:rhodanese-related sulfurtransferase